MIPTIYTTIFLELDLRSYKKDKSIYFITLYKIGDLPIRRGSIVTKDAANYLFKEPFNADGIIANYYPELLI